MKINNEEDSDNIMKVAVGTDELYSNFYIQSSENRKLQALIANPNCRLYTTVLNIAELYHRIQDKNSFEMVYDRIKSNIKIEKYCLDENFEKEYAENYENNSIFSFTLLKFCQENNIVDIIM